MQSQNHPPPPQGRQQRPPPLQQPDKVGRTKLPAGIMMLSPVEAVSPRSPRPVLGQLSNNNTAHAFSSSDEDSSLSNSQFSGTTRSKHSFGVPEASPSPDKLWRTPAASSAPSSQHTSPEFNHYRSRMQTSPSGHPSPTDTDMYMDENSSVSSATPIEAPTDMYTFATAAASILQQAREEEAAEDTQSVSDASTVSVDGIPPKDHLSSAPMPNWTNRNDGSVMDSYRNTILGTAPAPTMMSQTDKYGNDLNPLSPFRTDYTYSEDEDDSVLVDVPPEPSSHQTPMYAPRYSPESTSAPKPEFLTDRDDTPVRKNVTPYLPTVSPYRPGARVNPVDESAIDWQNYNDSTASPPRTFPSMLGDADSCNLSGAEFESPARFLRSTREETPVDAMEASKAEGSPHEEEPGQVEPAVMENHPDAEMELWKQETPDVKEPSKKNAPSLNEFYSQPGLVSPGEKSIVFSLDDCKTLAKQPETPGAKSIEFSLDACQADPELAMKPFLKQAPSADSTVPEDADEIGMPKPAVSKTGGAASKGTKTRVASKNKRRGGKEASSVLSNGANEQTQSDEEKPETGCCNFSVRCKLFGLLFLALLVFVPIFIGKWRERSSTTDDLVSGEASDFQATGFPTVSPVQDATDTTAPPTTERSTSKRPTNKGTREPSQPPVLSPSAGVTLMPTLPSVETEAPTLTPVADPTVAPVVTPTQPPTKLQTGVPTQTATDSQAGVPTPTPTKRQTVVPTPTPTERQTVVPTLTPTERQTGVPTLTPTERQTGDPTQSPTKRPTNVPTQSPTKRPTNVPTLTSSNVPTQVPTIRSTNLPSLSPSVRATESPTSRQTDATTPTPSVAQTRRPTTPGGAPIGRPSRPLADVNAPIGRPSLAGRPTPMEVVPTFSPVWSNLLTGKAMDDTNLGETHWPQYGTGLRLEILSTLENQWQPALEASVNDWNTFESVQLTVTNSPPEEECDPAWGKIKICNNDFGETNWRSSIEVYFANEDIVAVSLQVNDFYTMDQGWAKYTLCHQLGHAFGLGNTRELNCMRYVSLYSDSVSIQLQSPDQNIGEQLFEAYGPVSNAQRRLKGIPGRKMGSAEPFDRVVRYTV